MIRSISLFCLFRTPLLLTICLQPPLFVPVNLPFCSLHSELMSSIPTVRPVHVLILEVHHQNRSSINVKVRPAGPLPMRRSDGDYISLTFSAACWLLGRTLYIPCVISSTLAAAQSGEHSRPCLGFGCLEVSSLSQWQHVVSSGGTPFPLWTQWPHSQGDSPALPGQEMGT